VDEISFRDFIFLHIGITAMVCQEITVAAVAAACTCKDRQLGEKSEATQPEASSESFAVQNFAAFAPVY
jgi:hypothetical protein